MDKLLIGCIYKSPSSDKTNHENLNELLLKVSRIEEQFSRILVAGDFNFPKIDWAQWEVGDETDLKFIECIRNCYFDQLVDKPTRYRINQQPSTLDLLLVTDSNRVSKINYDNPLGSSYHCVLNFNYYCYINYDSNKSQKLNYFKARNKVKTVTRNERKRHEKQIAESAKTNCKTFWKYVNSKRKSISGISELHTKVNGTEFIASTDSEKAEVLAEFFSSVFTLESDNPVDSGKRYRDNFSSDELFNSKEVNKLLKDLNTSKSPGPDQVHPKVLFELANTIDSPLSSIFNESFKSVTVPQRWKIGQISALFKKGDKTSPSNYRPVSLTSIICKMMEKLVRQRIVQHMKSYNLLSDKQFAFIIERSTSLQLIKVE
ncbi:unnamed protein product [Mytilus edulis]|uniref:Endonuclease/exonuclease/phosphatase domain-containing protein n=1 Tax=Mytilus edulis TaxID=6550 RepID=A0A8S3RAZ0_MYTED|nr:unnamed protein product [Mytilus edulis]